jgi:hypothetical protein
MRTHNERFVPAAQPNGERNLLFFVATPSLHGVA